MHKLVQRKICLFLFIAASLFTSCSFFDNSLENNLSASVSFQINGIKSRSALFKYDFALAKSNPCDKKYSFRYN